MVLLNFKLTQLLHVYSQLLKNSLLHILLKLISKAQQQERGNIAIYVTIVHYRTIRHTFPPLRTVRLSLSLKKPPDH